MKKTIQNLRRNKNIYKYPRIAHFLPNPSDDLCNEIDEITNLISEQFEDNIFDVSETDNFSQKLLEYYHSEFDSDFGLTYSDIRPFLISLKRHLEESLNLLISSESTLATAIDQFAFANRKNSESDRGDSDILIFYIEVVLVTINAIISVQSPKRTTNRVRTAAEMLIDFYESRTGHKFKRSWAAPSGKTAKEKSDRRFKSKDAEFVRQVLKALDPSLTFSQIMTGLKATKTTKSQRD